MVGRLCKGVQHVETDVVTGFGVFGADIPQPNNEVFHIPGLFRSLGSSARRTGYANGADGGRSGGDELQVLELEVADEDGLAYAQFRNVHDDFVGKVLDQCADDQFAADRASLPPTFTPSALPVRRTGMAIDTGLPSAMR